MAIIKHWSDLKRRHIAWITEIRDRKCPGVPVPSVRRRSSMDEMEKVVVSAQKEAEEEEEQAGPSQPQQDAPPSPVGEEVEVEEAGPSRQPDPPSPAPDEEEEEEEAVTSPGHEEGLKKKMHPSICSSFRKHPKIIIKLQHEDQKAVQEIREQQKKIREQQRHLDCKVQQLEELHHNGMQEMLDLHKQLEQLP
ncbi:submandibular gland secretory Glx-rich protein CA-like [Bufo bufo]|uniref:submandibular gland secretory Glx-rich protein CA-like n=1 Tax=Bufo bufo TaxID=8384 RepID=UPI001ABEB6C8|nr:submandibular gland secretory Glx-rich protein CA-like [Bufo bufo]